MSPAITASAPNTSAAPARASPPTSRPRVENRLAIEGTPLAARSERSERKGMTEPMVASSAKAPTSISASTAANSRCRAADTWAWISLRPAQTPMLGGSAPAAAIAPLVEHHRDRRQTSGLWLAEGEAHLQRVKRAPGGACVADCVTLWIGESLGAVERACLRSVLRQGHSLALYCYDRP